MWISSGKEILIAEGAALDIAGEKFPWPAGPSRYGSTPKTPNNFRPDGGKVVESYPPRARHPVDGIIYQGYRIPMEYDSLLVKMTARGLTGIKQ